MTTALKYHGWEIVTGQDFREVIIIRDPSQPKISNPDYTSCGENGPREIYPPKDLTGWDVKMDIRVGPGSSSDLIKALSVGLGITLGGVDGSIELFIDNTETAVDPILENAGKRGYFDLFLIPPAPDDNIRAIYGTIPIIEATTDV